MSLTKIKPKTGWISNNFLRKKTCELQFYFIFRINGNLLPHTINSLLLFSSTKTLRCRRRPGQLSGWLVGVGVLVEVMVGRMRAVVVGMLLGEWGLLWCGCW